MEFEWDNKKRQNNIKKHGVDFEEARSVFDDIFAIIIDERFRSNLEKREIIVGESSKNRLLYVVFVEKKDSLRIISARKLTTKERKRYEQGEYE